MKYEEKPDIELKNLIEVGVITQNVKVYASINKDIIGVLNKDGAIILNIEGSDKVFPYPSAAARAIVKRSINGWKFWCIKENNDYIELSEIKKRFLLNR